VDGVVTCGARYNGAWTRDISKRSGEFFDYRLFNVFRVPVGFANESFEAQTVTPVLLFSWDIVDLTAMSHCSSPNLGAYWSLIVLQSMSHAAQRHHNGWRAADTRDVFDQPEGSEWVDGARSRNFVAPPPPPPPKLSLRQWFRHRVARLRANIAVLPRHGMRHRPQVQRAEAVGRVFLAECLSEAAGPNTLEPGVDAVENMATREVAGLVNQCNGDTRAGLSKLRIEARDRTSLV
jgi:hypothetical protein